jgi:hypothetical protein
MQAYVGVDVQIHDIYINYFSSFLYESFTKQLIKNILTFKKQCGVEPSRIKK